MLAGSLTVFALLASCTSSKTTGIAPADEFAGRWFDAQGRPLPDGSHPPRRIVLRAFTGPKGCGWESVAFIDLAWPVGTVATTLQSVHEYVRDPDGVVQKQLAQLFDPRATPPADALYTGFHHGIWQLWLADSVPGSAYVVGPASTERWPLVPERIGCGPSVSP
jgi:hypothetical protein